MKFLLIKNIRIFIIPKKGISKFPFTHALLSKRSRFRNQRSIPESTNRKSLTKPSRSSFPPFPPECILCTKKTGVDKRTNVRRFQSQILAIRSRKGRKGEERKREQCVSIVQICLRPRFEDQGHLPERALAILVETRRADRSIIRRFIHSSRKSGRIQRPARITL